MEPATLGVTDYVAPDLLGSNGLLKGHVEFNAEEFYANGLPMGRSQLTKRLERPLSKRSSLWRWSIESEKSITIPAARTVRLTGAATPLRASLARIRAVDECLRYLRGLARAAE